MAASRSTLSTFPEQSIQHTALEATAPAGIYKIGVVFSPVGSNGAIDRVATQAKIQEIVDQIAGGIPMRKSSANTVYVVVQTDILWWATQSAAPGSNGALYNCNNITFNPNFIVDIAEAAKAVGVKWTPLLSYHEEPAWVEYCTRGKYGFPSSLKDSKNNVILNQFLPFSPSSPVWQDYASLWTQQVVQTLKPYVGTVVDEIFLGNEMMYSGDVLTSYDEYAQTKWKSSHRGQLLPLTLTTEYQTFRATEWQLMLKTQVDVARRINPALNVSTKLVPGMYLRNDNFGITPAAVKTLVQSMQFVGFDHYGDLTGDSVVWNHLASLGKPLYLAEFNYPDDPTKNPPQCNPAMPKSVLKSILMDGILYRNLKSATMYGWDRGNCHPNADQRAALYEIINWIVTPPVMPTPSPTIRPTSTPTTRPTSTPTTRSTSTPTAGPTSTPVLTNIALNRFSYASCSESASYLPSKGNDGNTTTRWSSCQNTSNPWYNIDLGASRTINKITIRWESAYCTQFQINISSDNSSWTTYGAYTSSGGNQTLNFSNLSTRYISLYCVAKVNPAWGMSVWEWEIYGR
jgi:hypothetical protein